MRYKIERPIVWYDVSDLLPQVTTTLQTYEDLPFDTGLVDENGHKIVKVKDPIGFKHE